MSDDSNTLSRWVRLQRITWSCEQGSKAEKIVIERDGDRVHEFAVGTPDLANVLADALALQAEELPTGAHSFRLVAYDGSNVQLSELHQTVRGRSKEAASASNEAVTVARAAAMNVSNAAAATQLLRAELEREMQRNNDLVENQALLLDKLNEMQTQNFEAQLRLETFHREQDRKDKFSEAMSQLLVPMGTLLIEKFGPKLLQMQPAEILEKAKAVLDTSKKEETHVDGSSAQPVVSVVPAVHEPGQGTIQSGPETGPARDCGNGSPECGNAIAKPEPVKFRKPKSTVKRKGK
jgi:hypothetical protein